LHTRRRQTAIKSSWTKYLKQLPVRWLPPSDGNDPAHRAIRRIVQLFYLFCQTTYNQTIKHTT